jgi:hypothetical protein
MPTYIANRTTWLSHENRMVKEGEQFVTTFPDVDGKPMRIGDNLTLVEESAPEKPAKAPKVKQTDDLV